MVTLTEINEQQTVYEPTVADRIQRVLYRLDNGEQLIRGALRLTSGGFCIMGMLMDESGLDINSNSIFTETFQMYNISGSIDLNELSPDLLNNLETLLGPYNHMVHDGKPINGNNVSITALNDELVEMYAENTQPVNDLFAGFIRAGVLF